MYSRIVSRPFHPHLTGLPPSLPLLTDSPTVPNLLAFWRDTTTLLRPCLYTRALRIMCMAWARPPPFPSPAGTTLTPLNTFATVGPVLTLFDDVGAVTLFFCLPDEWRVCCPMNSDIPARGGALGVHLLAALVTTRGAAARRETGVRSSNTFFKCHATRWRGVTPTRDKPMTTF